MIGQATPPHVVVIGAGFGGLAAAYELGLHGIRVTVLESASDIGGLAGSFAVGADRLEKFYHHWFTSDVHALELIAALGLADRITLRSTRTGAWHAHNFYKLATPLDVLRFSPLPRFDRLRLGLLALRARSVRDWGALEDRTAADWLRELGGERVWRVVWEPLLRGKFGDLAEEVSAVWIWNKLKLRGGSRGKRGEERLAYFSGGFAALADALAAAIRAQGGMVRTGAAATGLQVCAGRATGVVTAAEAIAADAVIATPALPLLAGLMAPHVRATYADGLRRIAWLANVCIVLELRRSLSDLYWINVNDARFPFVGVIEHTNFEPASAYGGRHIVYLSRYLPEGDPLYAMSDEQVVSFALKHLRRMFPDFSDDQLIAAHVWRARYAQPVVKAGYARLIPATQTPIANLRLASMAQIYPQDRGTNYAIRLGRETARALACDLSRSGHG